MPQHPKDGDEAPKQPKGSVEPKEELPGEEDFGGGDFCSPEHEPSTEDDKPLD